MVGSQHWHAFACWGQIFTCNGPERIKCMHNCADSLTFFSDSLMFLSWLHQQGRTNNSYCSHPTVKAWSAQTFIPSFLFQIDDSKVTGKGVTTSVVTIEDGSLWYRPIPGDMLRTVHPDAQVSLPSVCMSVCLSHPVVHTYPWRHAEHCTQMSRHPTLSSVCLSHPVYTPIPGSILISQYTPVPGDMLTKYPFFPWSVSLLSPGLSVHTCSWEHTEQVSLLSPGLSVCLFHPVVHTYPLRHLNRYPFYSLVCLSHPVVHTCPRRHAVNHTPCPYVHASPTSCPLLHPVLHTCPMDMLSCVHTETEPGPECSCRIRVKCQCLMSSQC